MQTRRSFLKGLFTAAAVVAVEVRLAHTLPKVEVPTERVLWDTNARYSWGINAHNPLDLLILDRERNTYVSPEELIEHAKDELAKPGQFIGDTLHAFDAVSMIAISQGKMLWDGAKGELWVRNDELLVAIPGGELHDTEVGALRILSPA